MERDVVERGGERRCVSCLRGQAVVQSLALVLSWFWMDLNVLLEGSRANRWCVLRVTRLHYQSMQNYLMSILWKSDIFHHIKNKKEDSMA